MSKITDIEKWIVEIDSAEKFRDEQLGECKVDSRTKSGENLDYFERGYSDRVDAVQASLSGDLVTTLNLVDAITSIVVPALYSKNPRTIALPQKVEHEETAPLAGKLVDHYRRVLNVQETNKKIIWDAYIFNIGVYKISYVTKFGQDIIDEEKQEAREKARSIAQKVKEFFKPKKEEEVLRRENDIRVVAENPSIDYINPFNFGIDPRATNIHEARFLYQKVRKTVKEMKENKKYKNTSTLKGQPAEIKTLDYSSIAPEAQEDFETVTVYEVHYRNDGLIYLLVMSEDGRGGWEEHYHEETVYDIGDWQFDVLMFKDHGHTLYKRSDISKIKPLQDRLTNTIDCILEQVDKLVPKVAYKTGGLTATGKKSLIDGGIAALIECNEDPKNVFHVLNFQQLSSDLRQLIDQLITLISIQTGLTKAQLLGASDAATATEAQLEQGGQTLRFGDMSDRTKDFVNRQSQRLWKVIRQFVPLEELELINGVKGTDEATGIPKYDWLTISGSTADKMRESDYDFEMETGSTERVNLAVVRKAFENMFNILARTEVISLMQQQGAKVVLSELLKRYIDLFPELGIDAGKLIQQIQSQTGGMVVTPEEMRGGMTNGSQQNQMKAQMAEKAPNMPQQMGSPF